mgnify:FL=1
MDAPTAVLIILALAAIFVMLRAQRSKTFDFSDMLRDESGKASSLRFAILGSFAVSSWAFAYETISSSREWWVWAGYLGTWSGALVFKELASKWNGQLPWSRNDTQPPQ